MKQLRNLLGRTWFGLLNFGGLLGVIEFLTGWAGLAGEVYAGIPQPWSDVVRPIISIVSIVLLPLLAGMTLAAAYYSARRIGYEICLHRDKHEKNDAWATRELKKMLPEIEDCREKCIYMRLMYYSGMPPDPPLSDKALLTRLSFLCEQLESLGIDIAPANLGDRQAWLERLEVLATCARAGRIDAARDIP